MRVLIADDNVDLTKSLAMLLREWRFEALQANNGTTAMAALRDPDAPTLALLDWVMPGMNGIEICREIRKDVDRPYTYVILMTGRGGKQQMLTGLTAGADDYLIKPVDPKELYARLTTAKRILDLQDQLLATQRRLREQATRDSLTGLWNRAVILDILQREHTRGCREGHGMAVIMADIDHFKRINDSLGHLAGDRVLRHVAQRLQTAVRPYDAVGRYGGEEFLVVLPRCDADISLTLAQRLCRCVAAEPAIAGGRAVPVTISLGVAAWDGEASAQEVVRLVDEAMYRAKREGRNRAVAAVSGLGIADCRLQIADLNANSLAN
jgi:two-component system cell cycle response regulator